MLKSRWKICPRIKEKDNSDIHMSSIKPDIKERFINETKLSLFSHILGNVNTLKQKVPDVYMYQFICNLHSNV
jgi:hypothetical protein